MHCYTYTVALPPPPPLALLLSADTHTGTEVDNLEQKVWWPTIFLVSTTRQEGNSVCLCLMKIHRPFTVRNFYIHWMRSSREVRASGCPFQSRNRPGFDPSILRLCGIWGATDEAVLNKVQKKEKNPISPLLYLHWRSFDSYYFLLNDWYSLQIYHLQIYHSPCNSAFS